MSTVININHRAQSVILAAPNRTVWNINDLDFSDSDTWLRKAVDGTDYESSALALWTHHKNLRYATEKFAALITPRWPDSKGNRLLNKTIENAVTPVNRAIQRGEAFEGRVVGLYLYWISRSVDDVARINLHGVTSSGKRIRWPYFSVGIQSWVKQNNFTHLEAQLQTEDAAIEDITGLRTQLIGRITMNPSDAGFMEMHAPRG
jgi:hypothetical protein